MNKQEFLNILRDSLSMSLEQSAINEQIDYYDKYISDEIKKGKSEKEVIEELGDPRLIAKTIKTVSGSKTNVDFNDNSSEKKSSYNRSFDNYESNNQNTKYRSFSTDTTPITCAIIFLVVFIIVFSILRLLGVIIYGVGSFAFNAPVAFILISILFLWLFGGNRR